MSRGKNTKEIIFHLLDRRTVVALVGIGTLLVLGIKKDFDVSLAIATVCCGVAGANAYESSKIGKKDERDEEEQS